MQRDLRAPGGASEHAFCVLQGTPRSTHFTALGRHQNGCRGVENHSLWLLVASKPTFFYGTGASHRQGLQRERPFWEKASPSAALAGVRLGSRVLRAPWRAGRCRNHRCGDFLSCFTCSRRRPGARKIPHRMVAKKGSNAAEITGVGISCRVLRAPGGGQEHVKYHTEWWPKRGPTLQKSPVWGFPVVFFTYFYTGASPGSCVWAPGVGFTALCGSWG